MTKTIQNNLVAMVNSFMLKIVEKDISKISIKLLIKLYLKLKRIHKHLIVLEVLNLR